tara:strand:+ start:1025 stop:1210 length:186 start_codon:yes stop_codon:yes gene_type:complete
MPYEPGSVECLGLISAKDNILNAIKSLDKINGVDHIKSQMRTIYNDLDEMHEGRKVIENEN